MRIGKKASFSILGFLLIGLFLFKTRLPSIAWSYKTVSAVSLLSAHNDVLLGWDGTDRVIALDVQNGDLLWKRQGVSELCHHEEYVLAYDDQQSSLCSVRLADGKEIWRVILEPKVEKLIASKDAIFYIFKNKENLQLSAIDHLDGAPLWTTAIDEYDYGPAAEYRFYRDEGVLILYNESRIFGIDITSGKLSWRIDDVAVKDSIYNYPILSGHHLCYFDEQNGVRALRTRDGTWAFAGKKLPDTIEKGCNSLLWMDNGGIFICAGPEKMLSFDGKSLVVNWERKVKGEIVPLTFTVADGKIYFSTEKSGGDFNLLESCYVWSFHKDDGRPDWVLRTRRPTHSNIIIHKKRIFLATRQEGHRIYAYRQPFIRI